MKHPSEHIPLALNSQHRLRMLMVSEAANEWRLFTTLTEQLEHCGGNAWAELSREVYTSLGSADCYISSTVVTGIFPCNKREFQPAQRLGFAIALEKWAVVSLVLLSSHNKTHSVLQFQSWQAVQEAFLEENVWVALNIYIYKPRVRLWFP